MEIPKKSQKRGQTMLNFGQTSMVPGSFKRGKASITKMDSVNIWTWNINGLGSVLEKGHL